MKGNVGVIIRPLYFILRNKHVSLFQDYSEIAEIAN